MNLLINPSSMSQGDYNPPPLGLLFIAATDPDTVIVDMALDPKFNIENFLKETKPSVVGVPIYTAGRKESFRLLKLAKENGAVTVAGGPHVPLMFQMDWSPNEQYPFIDHFVFKDGEIPWSIIVKSPEIPGCNWTKTEMDLDSLPLPAYERIDYNKYPARPGVLNEYNGIDLRNTPRYSIVFGRGCIGHCHFCSTWWVHGKYHHHSVDWMTKHLQQLKSIGAKHLCFQDDCLTIDKQAFIDLCKVMEPMGFACFGTTRVDCVDDDITFAAKKAGFYELSFGIEHGSQNMLNKMNKETDISFAFKARESCAKAGIKFTALVMTGYPEETQLDALINQEFIYRLKPDHLASHGHTMIFPGTTLYSRCKAAGLLNDKFWLSDEPYYYYRGGLK